MARKYRNFVYDENQRFIYPTSDWGFKYLLGTEENKDLLLGLLQRLLPDLGILTVDYLVRDITIPVGKLKDASFDVGRRSRAFREHKSERLQHRQNDLHRLHR